MTLFVRQFKQDLEGDHAASEVLAFMFESIRTYRLNRRFVKYEMRELKKIQKLSCNSNGLRNITAEDLQAIFTNPQFNREWSEISGALDQHCNIPDGTTSAVNPGDRRALYYLVRGFQPRFVLEIGTNVGASTVHIAAALARQSHEQTAEPLTSVDIVDVNDDLNGPWRQLRLENSPSQMLQNLDFADLVTFVTSTSLDFLHNTPRKYDLIFLDGSHAAAVVYQEIPLALKSLAENGVILLHDFYPNNKPLWSADRGIVPGPWIAVERLRAEGSSFNVHPMGELPWATKLGTNITSLAVLTKIAGS
jgi:predicted O-methyltransferase YrrM